MDKVDKMMAVDPAYWATRSHIRLQQGVFSFKGREYQAVPMMSQARRICIMKGTQAGFTEDEVLKSLHGMIFGWLPRGVLYLFPTTDDVGEFSKARFGPLIAANPSTIGKYVKSGGKGTDTTSLKRVGKANLFLRGARLSQSIGVGEKDSTKLRSISVDKVVFDELDLMDDAVIGKARERMGDSEKKLEVSISNPLIPDRGIHALFLESDQRYFYIKCPDGHEVCAPLAFMDDPEKLVRIRQDGTGYIACPTCDKEITNRTDGVWHAEAPQNEKYMEGYHWSQLNSARNDPGEILSAYREPPQGNLAAIIRLKLGFPYVAAEERLTESTVFACSNNNGMVANSRGPCAMGVDVGKIKHVIIGQRLDRKRFQILKCIRLSEWNDIRDIARKFNVRSAVIDLRPYEDSVRDFQKSESYRIFAAEYTENATIDKIWDNKTKTVKVHRTSILDETHRLFEDKSIVIPRKGPEMQIVARQFCGTAKVLVENKTTGVMVYRYIKVGNDGDHYRHALNYFLLAADKSKLASVSSSNNRQTKANNDYVRG